MAADWHGLATETVFIYSTNRVLRGNVLIAMSLSALICVHLRFHGSVFGLCLGMNALI